MNVFCRLQSLFLWFLLLWSGVLIVHPNHDPLGCQFTHQDSFWPTTIGKNLFNLTVCDSVCKIEFKGLCQCFIVKPESIFIGIRLECYRTNASILIADIDSLSQCNYNLIELHVKNSNLTHLYNLPSGLYNIQNLVLDNTSIDLETLRESNELLRSLKVLRISNENFTEIPETLFNGMEELKELSLNNLALAYINIESFISLQDSLTLLELRSNQIRTIPTAVQILSHLECLDLSGNSIKSVSDGNALILSTSLKRLKRLRLNFLKCSCEFGKSKFVTWLRTHAIKEVHCLSPSRLIDKDVSNMPYEEFCELSINGQPSHWFISSERNIQKNVINFLCVLITNILTFSFFKILSE